LIIALFLILHLSPTLTANALLTLRVTYTYDLNDRFLTSTKTPERGRAEVTTYTYDRNGNQLTQTTDGRTERKYYNAFNQLIRVVNGPVLVDVTYHYRADGLRRSKTVGSMTTPQ